MPPRQLFQTCIFSLIIKLNYFWRSIAKQQVLFCLGKAAAAHRVTCRHVFEQWIASQRFEAVEES